MTTKNIQGVITIATAAIGFSALAITSWMGWVSLTVIDNKTNLATTETTLQDMSKKLDWILSERYGANPQAIEKFYQTNPLTNASR